MNKFSKFTPHTTTLKLLQCEVKMMRYDSTEFISTQDASPLFRRYIPCGKLVTSAIKFIIIIFSPMNLL